MNRAGRSADEIRERQRQFRAALAMAERSVKSVCQELGVTENHLYLVMRGDRESRRIDAAVDALIAEYLPNGIQAVPMPLLTPERSRV